MQIIDSGNQNNGKVCGEQLRYGKFANIKRNNLSNLR